MGYLEPIGFLLPWLRPVRPQRRLFALGPSTLERGPPASKPLLDEIPTPGACERWSRSNSDRGIGVGTGFVGPGFDVAPVDCWAPVVFPLRTQQNEINKPIRSTRRIRAKSELFWDPIFRTRFRSIAEALHSPEDHNTWQRVSLISAGLHTHFLGDQVACQPVTNWQIQKENLRHQNRERRDNRPSRLD